MGRIVAKLRQLAWRGFRQVGGQGMSTGSTRPVRQASMGEPKVKSHIPGAALRALLVALLVILPAVMLPGIPPETAQAMLLLALFAGGLIFAEYASAYPGLIEFRFAAPFNRTRFLLLALMAVLLALLLRQTGDAGAMPGLVQTLALSCAQLLDFAFSPVSLLAQALPQTLPEAHLDLVRQGAALALVLGLTTLLGFVVAIRLNVWPMGHGPFNVWINLPTFDPTAGSDVVLRLQRHARINIALGAVAPFLFPLLVKASGVLVQPLTLETPMGFVWGIVLWAFLPVSMVMRGVAMIRVARMIRANRRRFADSEGNAFATA